MIGESSSPSNRFKLNKTEEEYKHDEIDDSPCVVGPRGNRKYRQHARVDEFSQQL